MGLNENLNRILDGEGSQRVASKWKDYGLIIDGDNGGNGNWIAAGAYVTIDISGDLGWAKTPAFFGKSSNGTSTTCKMVRGDGAGNYDATETTVTLFNDADTWKSTISTTPWYVGWGMRIKVTNGGGSSACVWLRFALIG
ncbi:MAG: hypothetical protein ABFD83_13880 [Armatimonadota bacterium]